MSAAKRQRGATAIRKDEVQLPQLALPQSLPFVANLSLWHLAAAALVIGVVLAAALTANLRVANQDDNRLETTPSPVTVEPAEVALTSETEVLEKETRPPWQDVTVRKGDNLSLIFKRAGFDDGDVHRVVSQARDGKSLARIYPGQIIAFRADDGGELAAVRHVQSPVVTVTYRLTDSGFESDVEERTPESRESWAAGEITSSLFLAGKDAGLSHTMIMELANIFGGVIDFVLDPRKGDTFHVIYDELYLDGEKYKDGAILAASFTNQGETFNAYRYQDNQGDVSYYNEDGVSMRKAFLLAPVDFTRISSNFNPNRLHPIYKTKRPHRGTDYAAPTGTPVFAAGDGRVVKAGYNRANGNYVFIQHGEQYVTKYLHLHKRKVKQGQRVSQSQVIGSVGSTGAATGPHLHYEFLMNGVHRNPRTIHKKLPKAKALPGSEMARFREAIRDVSVQLASLRSNNNLAMNTDTPGLPGQ
jgi:murein DD-endopeptidase MepM/ murein hydrolase activator NlpD